MDPAPGTVSLLVMTSCPRPPSPVWWRSAGLLTDSPEVLPAHSGAPARKDTLCPREVLSAPSLATLAQVSGGQDLSKPGLESALGSTPVIPQPRKSHPSFLHLRFHAVHPALSFQFAPHGRERKGSCANEHQAGAG